MSDIAAIAAMPDPLVRNLRITQAYFELSTAIAARTGSSCNWCTFATWASRQAGATIRGEDLLDGLQRRLRRRVQAQHPIRSFWRALLRRGLFRPDTRLGRIVRTIHSPFDAFERTSAAVAAGNLKVFDEIGRAFAHWLESCPPDVRVDDARFVAFAGTLRAGEPPAGQEYLRRAFTCYQAAPFEADPRRRGELMALANLLIGLHEQTRLQPEIRASLDTPVTTARELRLRLLARLPGGPVWRALLGTPVATPLVAVLLPLRRFAERLAREVITDCLMVLALPDGSALRLGRPLGFPIPDALRQPAHADLASLLSRFERCTPERAIDAEDWSDLGQRMHFILHLFCAFTERRDLFSPPFTDAQVARMESGTLPDGRL